MASLLARLAAALRPAPTAALLVRGEDGIEQYQGMAVTGYPTAPEVDPAAIMRTVSRYPWVYACVQAITDDLCSLPLYVERPAPKGAKSKGGMVPVDHPAFFALLARPTPSDRQPGVQLLRQWVADYVTTHMAYLWLDQPRSPAILRRLHPDHVEGIADTMGLPTAWQVGDAVVERVPPDRLIQAKGISWSPHVEGELYATSPIQAIADILATERATMESMRRAARMSRPDSLLTPPDGTEWTPEQAKRIVTWVREWRLSEGGTLALPYGAKLSSSGHSPRDMEYIAALERATKATLAVFRVPPSRVIEGSANFATAQQEAILYWEARQAESVVLDDALTRLARRWPGFEDVTVRRDFSGVDALQAGKESRLRRVSVHIMNGMDPVRAYEVEGLDYEAGAMAQSTPATPTADPATTAADRHLRAALERLDTAPDDGLSQEQARALALTLRAATAARRPAA